MQLISGTLRPITPCPWLLVLANTEPPPLRRNAASAKLVEKQLLMTAGQFTVISFTHHHSDCDPGVNHGKILIQQTSQVSGEKTGIRLRWSTPTYLLTPKSDNQVLTSLDDNGLS